MNNNALVLKSCLIIIAFLSTFNSSLVHAEGDLGLCPAGFEQGVVSTGFVECLRESSRRSTREQAELERLQREAICEAHPNSAVTSSAVFAEDDGRFFSMVVCTVTRSIPPGTVLCPDNSEEVYRAFDTLICQDFGNASLTAAQAQSALAEQIEACTSVAGGQIIDTELGEELFDDVMFFTSSVVCSLTTAAVDNIECPFGFRETDRDEDSIECEAEDRTHETLEEAESTSSNNMSICTDTTAGLGSVNPESMIGMTSNDGFFSLVVCDINIARFGEFEDSATIRACDATCTEEIEQARMCLNGGTIGGPGCIESSTQLVERRCNTGPLRGGSCPLVTPMTDVTPLILFAEED